LTCDKSGTTNSFQPHLQSCSDLPLLDLHVAMRKDFLRETHLFFADGALDVESFGGTEAECCFDYG